MQQCSIGNWRLFPTNTLKGYLPPIPSVFVALNLRDKLLNSLATNLEIPLGVWCAFKLCGVERYVVAGEPLPRSVPHSQALPRRSPGGVVHWRGGQRCSGRTPFNGSHWEMGS